MLGKCSTAQRLPRLLTYFKTRSLEAGLKLAVMLPPLPPECWYYRCALPPSPWPGARLLMFLSIPLFTETYTLALVYFFWCQESNQGLHT